LPCPQIVKAAEPVFSALVNSLAYKSPPSLLKVLCLPVIVGGVAFASLKPLTAGAVGSLIPGYALSFNQNALLFGVMANVFAAFKVRLHFEDRRGRSFASVFARFMYVVQYSLTYVSVL